MRSLNLKHTGYNDKMRLLRSLRIHESQIGKKMLYPTHMRILKHEHRRYSQSPMHQSYAFLHDLEWSNYNNESIDNLHSLLREGQVTVFGAALSPYTQAAKHILDKEGVSYREVNIECDCEAATD